MEQNYVIESELRIRKALYHSTKIIQAKLETDGRKSHLFRFQTCVKLRLNAIRLKTKIPEFY